ncbi:hydrogenase-4 component E [Roseomonas sp. 18066]|uniref:hydrogenase-4 component E n=1 Tax=Roseomonas sp. 18066 TaxID=2681412 RepID=UPI00135850AA|nr:hydrogenase-4 component E [Roseomonas sp. 18066]
MNAGGWPYDVAHMLGGGVLLFSFVLLYQRRLVALVSGFATQGALLALAIAWQGFFQEAPLLLATAVISGAVKAVVIPLALRRLLKRLRLQRELEPGLGVGPSLVAGVGLVTLAILVVLPATAGAAPLAREDLAISLSVVLLGMLMMITRRHAISQGIGLLSLQNGLVLAATGVPGLPLVVELSTAALVLALVAVAGFFALALRQDLGALDLSRPRAPGEGPE